MKCKNCGHEIFNLKLKHTVMSERQLGKPAKIIKVIPINNVWFHVINNKLEVECLCGCKNPEPKEGVKQK